MSGIGIADILREMRKVDVLVGEMQQMSRPFPGAERTEGNARLFLEQMQEARRRHSRLGGAACRRHRLAGEFSDLHNGARHAGIEFALRQGLAEAQQIELGAGKIIAGVMLTQLALGVANAAGESGAFRPREAPGEIFEHAGTNALRLDHDAEHRTIIAGDGVPDVRQQGDHFAVGFPAIGGGEPETALKRDIDVEPARAALPRPAEQAGVEHALRGDQHQMAGFVADIVHGSSSSRGSLAAATGSTIAEIRCLSPTEEAVIPGREANPESRNSGSGANAPSQNDGVQARIRGATFCSIPALRSAATARWYPSRSCNRAQ